MASRTNQRAQRRAIWGTIAFLTLVVLAFFVRRLVIDWPLMLSGAGTDNAFARRYVQHPVVAYLHILPGVVFLLAAIGQLNRRHRNAHLDRHRKIGRALVPIGIVAGALAIAFGSLYPWGDALEAAAAIVFGAYFIAALALGFRAIRAHDIAAHRRWMIRAFAVALAVGSIRVWLGILVLAGIEFHRAFGAAFCIGLTAHAAIAEVYLRGNARSRHGREPSATYGLR